MSAFSGIKRITDISILKAISNKIIFFRRLFHFGYNYPQFGHMPDRQVMEFCSSK
jgi:hypothetical protein